MLSSLWLVVGGRCCPLAAAAEYDTDTRYLGVDVMLQRLGALQCSGVLGPEVKLLLLAHGGNGVEECFSIHGVS